jgi:hypothetical protein
VTARARPPARVLALGCALAVGTATLAALPADATHTFPRKLTVKHANGKLKGKLKSPSPECRAGIVTVHRVRRGADPIVASDAASGGRWKVRAPRRGRFYASAESFMAPSGRCPDVRSRAIEIG